MENHNEVSKPKGHTRVQWAVAITVNLTLFTYGLQCGWMSPMVKVLQSEESPVGRPMTDTEISLIAAVPSIGAVFGILIMVYIVDTFGRKWSVILTAGSQLLCWLITIYPANFTTLIIARVFSGIGGGGCFHIVPMYIREISQDSIRGTLGSVLTLFQNLGIFAIYALGGYLDYYTVLYTVIGIPAVTILMLLKAPESPSFLVKQGKFTNAATNIAFLRGLDINNKEVHAAVDSLKREDDHFKSIPNITFYTIFKVKAWRRGFLIMVVICSMRASNGAYVILHYAASILSDFDTNISPELLSLSIPVCMMFSALLTMSSIDRLGRKLLLSIYFTISALTFSLIGSCLLLRENGWIAPGWLSVVALLLAVSCYGGGVSPIPFVIMSEMFNFQIRAKLLACLNIESWFLAFLQVLFFTTISNSTGVFTSFYIFGAINIIGALLVVLILPETRGKSVEEIEAELIKEKKPEAKSVGG